MRATPGGALARKYEHQALVRRAFRRRRGHAHEQPAVTHGTEAFRLRSRAHAQVQEQVRALLRAPSLFHQGSSLSSAPRRMQAHSGEKSMPPIGGMIRWNGRSTGAHSEVRMEFMGE